MQNLSVKDLSRSELDALKAEYVSYTPRGRMHAHASDVSDAEIFDHYRHMRFDRAEFARNEEEG